MFVLFALFLLLFTGVIFFVDQFLLLLGPSYRESGVVIKVVSLAFFFNSMKLIMHNPLSYVKSKVKYKSLIWVFTAILNVGLNLWLIPKLSFNGAAISTLIAYSVTMIPVYFLSQKAFFLKLDFRGIFKLTLIVVLLFATQYIDLLQAFYIKIPLFVGFTGFVLLSFDGIKKNILNFIKK